MEIGNSVIDLLREKLKNSVLVSYTPISHSLWHSVWNSLIDPRIDSLWDSVNASARNMIWK
jgi:hypothetical protein